MRVVEEVETVMTQRKISALVDKESHSRLIEAVTVPRELARLKCVSREGAGDWLTALPSQTLGLHLRKTEFITAIRYRLGMPIFRTQGECPRLVLAQLLLVGVGNS